MVQGGGCGSGAAGLSGDWKGSGGGCFATGRYMSSAESAAGCQGPLSFPDSCQLSGARQEDREYRVMAAGLGAMAACGYKAAVAAGEDDEGCNDEGCNQISESKEGRFLAIAGWVAMV